MNLIALQPEFFSLRRILKYSGVHLGLLPINLGLAWALQDAGMDYVYATLAGITVHVSAAFIINRRLTFERPDLRTVPGLFRAFLVEFSSILIVLGTTIACVEWAQLSFIVARSIAVVVVGGWAYTFDSFFTFAIHKHK